ncbi:zeta toxin family protein [Streptomyces sp. C36]|uniref:zeta toxin family protein n=1 Tax=Streptomyces sp. C36 TaxID=3237122 RepID=UPI0034C61124
MAEASDYFLAESELAAIFHERRGVKNFLFSRFSPQSQPVLVLLGGQPAAGKSQAMKSAQQRHADRQLVPLTGDELRPFHPQHHEILEKEPWLFPDATGQASGAWVRMSIDHALENRYSLMLEGVFRDPAMTLSTAERFAEAGYTVEVVGLAVREERSRLDGLHRYLEGGRWTPPDLHDLALRMMPETIAAAEASPAVHRITITDRSGADLYVNERGPDGLWTGEPAAVQALTAGRARPLPADDAGRWMERQREVIIDLAARGQIDATSRPVLQRVSADAEAVAVMADPDPRSELRVAHTAVQSMLEAVVSEPPTSDIPLTLVPDAQLSQLHSRLARAEEAALRVARPPTGQEPLDAVQLLTKQGAPQEVIDRARKAAQEDQQYARGQARAAQARSEQLGGHRQQAAAEITRRRGLSPVQRQAEDGLRQQLHAALGPARPSQTTPPPQAVSAPRLRGPQHPPRGQGRSL